MAIVSLWTPLAFERIAARWFTLPNIFFLWPVPMVTALVALACWRWLEAGRDVLPFLAAIALFPARLSRPRDLELSLSRAAVADGLADRGAPSSQIFMLIGTLILLPIILGYIVFVYWVFRGKVREGEGYHS